MSGSFNHNNIKNSLISLPLEETTYILLDRTSSSYRYTVPQGHFLETTVDVMTFLPVFFRLDTSENVSDPEVPHIPVLNNPLSPG